RLTVLWGGPHETRRHLETGLVHDRGYRQQRARKCVRQGGGGTFTAAGRVFGFETTKSGEPLARTPESSNASRPPIISYSGNYRSEGSDLAAKVDLAWDDGWPRTEELHHYRLEGDKRLVETTHLRYPNAFGSRMISILVWERE